jgi:PKD repeat protein
VLDDDGGEATADASIEVRNAPPSMLQIAPLGVIDENGLATLSIAFVDPGTLDAHTIDVDWGDGTTESFGVAVGARTFATTHRYLDDNPSSTPADDYLVKVRIRDDDGGSADAGATVTVRNVAPSNVVISPSVIATDEGRVVEIGVTFDDPGSQDDHVYFVNWGDGFESAGGAAGPFSASHIYADNGAYTVTVTLVDDDGGVGVATTTIAVRNVAPTLTVVGNQTVNEGSLLSLTDLGVFTDPGIDNPYNVVGGPTVEQFTYRVDWGDGRPADTGPATIDAPMYLGEPTRGSFDGQHIYADDGTYTVTVTVQDDDGGTDMRLFQVTVRNVDPTLSGLNSLPAVREGDWITLATLGVGVVDPGFDNQLNAGHPSNGGEFEETFTGVTVDWGDGTPADALAVVNRTSGALGVPTTADFSHAPHVYADNGAYTVTVKLSDDDGGVVVRTFTLVVENVAPVLTLTDESFVRNEGSTLAIARLGDFTDPGFDNPLNGPNASNGGETEETFTYTIDWGDGTVQSGQLPATRTSGSAGTPTTGTLAHSHFYADNDADNRYTITVTLADDDGGVDVKSFEIIVYNVNPTLQPISATDVNKSGQTTLTLAFSDPGADSFQVLVDWGDKLDLPPDQRYLVETAYAGPTPQTFVLTHTYSGPPDPLHPAADIAISVKVRDDDFGIAAVVQPGESNVETVAITNPGTGTQPFRIDTTPQVALLTFPERPAAPVVLAAVDARPVASAAGLIAGASGDSQATGERYLELRVIRPDGTLSPGYRLRPEVLKNLPGLFRNLPDNHYAIYLVQPETDVRRLVVEVFVRNGKLIDPGDDTEGARDRPPTDDATPAARQAPPQPAPPIPEAPPSSDSDAATSPPPARHSSTSMVHRTALVSAALALSGAGRQWQRELDRAKSGARRNSRRTGRSQPKKPR